MSSPWCFGYPAEWPTLVAGASTWPLHCTMCCLYSIFSSWPNKLGHTLKCLSCNIIYHFWYRMHRNTTRPPGASGTHGERHCIKWTLQTLPILLLCSLCVHCFVCMHCSNAPRGFGCLPGHSQAPTAPTAPTVKGSLPLHQGRTHPLRRKDDGIENSGEIL